MKNLNWRTVQGFYIIVTLFIVAIIGVNIYMVITHKPINILSLTVLNMLCITTVFGFYANKKAYDENKGKQLVYVDKTAKNIK